MQTELIIFSIWFILKSYNHKFIEIYKEIYKDKFYEKQIKFLNEFILYLKEDDEIKWYIYLEDIL